MIKHGVFRLACVLTAILPLGACGGGTATGLDPSPAPSGRGLSGSVFAGKIAVSGASIQILAVGNTGNGSQATPLLSSPAHTDTLGKFNFTYACPSSSALIYVVATGGAPASSGGSTNNDAISFMTALGACGDLNSSSTVFVNEVTTVGSVFALAQFIGLGGNVGASSSNTQGLANAFATVNNLVDATTGMAPGVPQPAGAKAPTATLNTIANVLNSCSSGAGSCAGLFAAATPPGATAPANTLDVALALARNPGLNSGPIFALVPANPQFTPLLAQAPNDWMLSFQYIGGGLHGPSALALDEDGNVWVANYFGAVSELSTQGETLSPADGFTGGGLNECYGLTIDLQGKVWVTNQQSGTSVNHGLGSLTELDSHGQILSGSSGFSAGGINFPVAAVSDFAGNIWIANYGSSSASLLANSGAAISGANGYGTGQLDFPVAVTVDDLGNAWLANQGSTTLTRITADGAQATSFSCCSAPSGLATDGHGNLWVTNFLANSVSELSPAGAVLSAGFTGGGLLRPQGIAVDGNGNAWITNYHGNSITELQGADGNTPGAALSPARGYGVAQNLNLPFALAVDASGNLWVSNFTSDSISKFVGVAAPVKTPLLGSPKQP